jgi:hypothetical protein
MDQLAAKYPEELNLQERVDKCKGGWVGNYFEESNRELKTAICLLFQNKIGGSK